MASTKRMNVKFSENDIKSLYMGIMNKKQGIEKDIETYENQSGKKFPLEFKSKEEENNTQDSYDYVRPTHYKQDDGKETWELMVEKFGLEETATFCEINAYKYRDRMGKKPNEDVERESAKAEWYEAKAIELREEAGKGRRNNFGLFN